jgi:preprotein translocase subunit SecG
LNGTSQSVNGLIGTGYVTNSNATGASLTIGGAGGSSPFGSRAGDAFTKFTLIVAAVWAIAIIVEVKLVQTAGAASSVLGSR